MSDVRNPITVSLVDDYDVVLRGLAHMFDSYRHRVLVAEIDANAGLDDTVDIVLYDSFAQPESDLVELARLVANPRARRVVVYTWNFQPDLVAASRVAGVHGYLSKSLSPEELVLALEAVHAGRIVVTDMREHAPSAPGLDWPGKLDGITDRESEVLALITQGMSNAQVAALTYLSPNTVKSYIRSVYRKIGVTTRDQAIIWGAGHGFSPDHHRIDHWLGGP